MIKYSLYSSAFNVIDNQFDYESHIDNFCEFIKDDGEVVIMINKSVDDSYERIRALKSKYSNLVVFGSNVSYDDPGMDGQIKNLALQETEETPIKIHMDLDELLVLSQRPAFEAVCSSLLNSNYQAAMVPVINLYKDLYHYKDIGFKWRIHKEGLYRGVVNFAKNPDGTHDITKSDGCELIDSNGNLVNSAYLIDPSYSDVNKLDFIRQYDVPYILHCGLIDLKKKVIRNKNFWANHWKVESGRDVDIPTTEQELEIKINNTVEKFHGLPVE